VVVVAIGRLLLALVLLVLLVLLALVPLVLHMSLVRLMLRGSSR
jgi:hypothetical protein